MELQDLDDEDAADVGAQLSELRTNVGTLSSALRHVLESREGGSESELARCLPRLDEAINHLVKQRTRDITVVEQLMDRLEQDRAAGTLLEVKLSEKQSRIRQLQQKRAQLLQQCRVAKADKDTNVEYALIAEDELRMKQHELASVEKERTALRNNILTLTKHKQREDEELSKAQVDITQLRNLSS